MSEVRYKQISTQDWNIKNAYDADTYVQYDGDTYVSTKYVPIGVNIGFSNYWKKISVEEDIEDLQEDVADIESDITDINNNTIHKMFVKIANNIPTTEELAELTFDKTGTIIVDFALNSGNDQTTIRSTLIYTRAVEKYGAGILISFYSNGVISYVRNNNNTWTITPITLTT